MSHIVLFVLLFFQLVYISSGTVLATNFVQPFSDPTSAAYKTLTQNPKFELSVVNLPIIRNAFLAYCRTNDDCPHTLRCRSEDAVKHTSIDCNSATDDCWCINPLQICDSSDDCAVGDVCVAVSTNSTDYFCVPCRSLKSPSRRSSPPVIINGSSSHCFNENGNYKREPVSFVDKNVYPNTDVEPENFFLRGCTSSFDCQRFHLECHTERNDGSKITCPFANQFEYIGHAAGCACLDYTRTCNTSDDCQITETCVKLFPSSVQSICISCLSLPTRHPNPIEQIGSQPRCPSPTPYAVKSPYHQRNGHLQRCRKYSDCDGHICVTETNNGSMTLCENLSTGCVCFDLFAENECQTSDDCQMGERCVKLYDTSQRATCVPCSALTSLSHKRVPLPVLIDAVVDSNNNNDTTSTGSNIRTPCDRILSVKDTEMYVTSHLQRCTDNFQAKRCGIGLSCNTLTNGGYIRSCQYNSQTCFCLNSTASNACVSSTDCSSGDITDTDVGCYKLTENAKVGYCLPKSSLSNLNPSPIPFYNISGSPGSTSHGEDDRETETEVEENTERNYQVFNDSSEPSEEPEPSMCIAAHALKHLPRDSLIYSVDVQAFVLCDPMMNCATPGHIIIYQGVAMMMKSYCQQLQILKGVEKPCTKKVMHVNSIRMGKRRRISSSDEAFQYTALAARAETTIEEGFLALIIRIGF